MIHIRRLIPQESLIWKNFRIQSLLEDPEAFFSPYPIEEENDFTELQLQERLEKQTILGAFNNEILVGTLGLRTFEGTKLFHRGILFDLHVHPQYREIGIEENLLKSMLEIAKKKIIQVHASVFGADKEYFDFYQRHGFEWMAAHPRSLKIGEQFYDEEILILKLDG